MNFTKGEWKHAPDNRWDIVSDTGHWFYPICVIDHTTDEAKANAHLIAAAPEMYEALKHTSIVLYNLKVSNLGELTQQQTLLEIEVNKALAKAEGK